VLRDLHSKKIILSHQKINKKWFKSMFLSAIVKFGKKDTLVTTDCWGCALDE